MNLTELVLSKVRSFGTTAEAADFFSVVESEVVGWTTGSPIPVSALEKVWRGAIPTPPVSDKKVTILLPWYKTSSPITTFALLGLLDKARMAVMLNFDDAFVAHARNKLSDNFLSTKSQIALMVDDDMVIPWGNAAWHNQFSGFNLPDQFAGLNTVDRLLSHRKTLVGALYWGRRPGGRPVYAEGRNDKEFLRRGPHDECRPTRWVGTGCMLIHRSVFEDIEKKFPHLARNSEGKGGNWFTSSEHDLKEGAFKVLDVLDDESASVAARVAKSREMLRDLQAKTQAHSKLGTGEDVQFCIRAAQAGHQPHVDLGLVCGHIGSKVYGPPK